MTTGEVTASFYAGRPGVPAYFPVSVFPSLMELRGDAGAKGLLRSARLVELVGGELDIDTVEDLERARELFG
jgi:CTP:molybdopterin cytidylyltransferase MocA